jgi:hypothetical protein
MARTKISEFSSTPASNTDIDSIFIGEGMAPSNVNDAIRELMAQLKDWQSGTSNDPYVVGSSGSLTLNQGTANGVPYLNGSKVVTSGSALVFDGTNFGVGGTPTHKLTVIGGDLTIDNARAINFRNAGGGVGNVLAVDSSNRINFGDLVTSASAMVLSSGNLGLGVTPSAWNSSSRVLQFGANGTAAFENFNGVTNNMLYNSYRDSSNVARYVTTDRAARTGTSTNGGFAWELAPSGTAGNAITFTQAMTLDSSGNLLVGTTTFNSGSKGFLVGANGRIYVITSDGSPPYTANRLGSDGVLVEFQQDNAVEGTISVSGTTVSYNGGHLSRWAQTTIAKDESIVKGTVLSNLDEMNVYTKDGQPVDNEQLNKVKVSDVEGDVNVAGVFVNWTHDEQHNVDEINMAMTGDMIIRIAQGTTVQRGDLLMSAGDGTAKPQGDDIVRSKTIAKVTSTHVTCTYADGSYCVPCVLMAC